MKIQNLIRLSGLALVLILTACAEAQQTPTDIPATQLYDQFLTVSDQSVSAGIVTIDEVIIVRTSWVVIHPEENGNRNPRIGLGRTALTSGKHANVEISIDLERATPVLYAEMHDDLGSPGESEALDRPAKPSVLVSFTVTLP